MNKLENNYPRCSEEIKEEVKYTSGKTLTLLETLAEIESTVKDIKAENSNLKGLWHQGKYINKIEFTHEDSPYVTYYISKTTFVQNALNMIWH